MSLRTDRRMEVELDFVSDALARPAIRSLNVIERIIIEGLAAMWIYRCQLAVIRTLEQIIEWQARHDPCDNDQTRTAGTWAISNITLQDSLQANQIRV